MVRLQVRLHLALATTLIYLSLTPGIMAVNRTIDDSFGDSLTGQLVTYSPATGGVWKDQTCIDCAIDPDVRQAFRGTYTASTYNAGLGSTSITMQFTGTAIYVFFILANDQGPGITTFTTANFTVDNKLLSTFVHVPDQTTSTVLFNQLVFSQQNLANTKHTLVISTSGINQDVYVNFDYAIYTQEDIVSLPITTTTTTTSTSSTSTTSTTSATSTTSTTSTSTTSTTTKSQVTTTGSTTSGSGIPTLSTNPNDALNSNATERSQVSVGAIAGGVVGGIVVLVLIVLLLLFCRRRNRRAGRGLESGNGRSMMDLAAEDQAAAVISPFADYQSQAATSSSHPHQVGVYGAVPTNSISQLSMSLQQHTTPNVQSDNGSAYGGYVSDNGIDASSSGRMDSSRGPLRLATVSEYSARPPSPGLSYVESTRRARQNELDERLRVVQQEMQDLATDVSSDEINEKHQSVRRRRTVTSGPAGAEMAVEEEVSMEDMKEQLRYMREQIAFLQEQQRSAWALGLSDDPPPGYS